MHKILFTFFTTHQALSAEKKMKREKLSCRLIPTPMEIFAECGFSLELELDDPDLQGLLLGKAFVFAESYRMTESEKGKIIYKKIHH